MNLLSCTLLSPTLLSCTSRDSYVISFISNDYHTSALACQLVQLVQPSPGPCCPELQAPNPNPTAGAAKKNSKDSNRPSRSADGIKAEGNCGCGCCYSVCGCCYSVDGCYYSITGCCYSVCDCYHSSPLQQLSEGLQV